MMCRVLGYVSSSLQLDDWSSGVTGGLGIGLLMTIDVSVVNGHLHTTLARFTKYLTIYRKIIVKSTYGSDLQHAKISPRNITS